MKCKTCNQEIKAETKVIQKIPAKTLVWGPDSDNKMTRNEAIDWCKQQGGRLPTRVELVQAFDDDVPGFRNPAGDYRGYWSATTVSDFTTNAWTTYLSNGFTVYDDKATGTNYVRNCKEG